MQLRYQVMLRVCASFGTTVLRSTAKRGLCSSVSQAEYDRASDEYLDRLADYMDQLPERMDVGQEFDVNCAMGVLTVSISKQVGTYVINKQGPNKQIWLSSPLSGPKRYDLVSGQWVYSREQEHLGELLTREFRKIYASDDIDFKKLH